MTTDKEIEFGDTTTEFKFCLYNKLQSTQNCTDGLFSSLSNENQQELWSRIFPNTTNIGNESNENGNTVFWIIIMTTGITSLLLVVFFIFGALQLRRKRDSWRKKTTITIPNEELDDDDSYIEMQPLTQNNFQKENNDRGLILQYEMETKSCHSDDASTGYGSGNSLTGSERSITSLINECPETSSQTFTNCPAVKESTSLPCDDSDQCDYNTTPDGNDADSAKEQTVNTTDVIKASVTALLSPDRNSNQESKSSGKVCHSEEKKSFVLSVSNGVNLSIPEENNSTSCTNSVLGGVYSSTFSAAECNNSNLASVSKEVNFTEVSVSEAAISTLTSNSEGVECTTVNVSEAASSTESVNTTIVNVSEGTNQESDRLDWHSIFRFLIERIDPTMYTFFFIELLEKAGAKNPQNLISSAKMDTTCIKAEMLKLFQYWKQGARSAAMPKHIEEVCECLGWNRVLSEFRELMRNPPYLSSDRNWTEPSIPSNVLESRSAIPQQPLLVKIQVNSREVGQAQTRNISFTSSETVEENMMVNNVNGITFLESCRNIRRRKCDEISEESTKYMRLDKRSLQNTAKRNKRQKQKRKKRKKYKIQSKLRNDVNSKTEKTSRNAPCSLTGSASTILPETNMYSSSPYESFSSAPSSGLGVNSSSGYSSMSSNMDSANRMSYNDLNTPCKSTHLNWTISSNSIKNRKREERRTQTPYNNTSLRQGRFPKMSKQKKLGINSSPTENVIDDFLDSIIGDLLRRMTPSREDVQSLTFQAYTDAECLITSWNEKIFVISSKRQSLPMRESEWNTVKEYVGKVRNKWITNSRKYPHLRNAFLFTEPNDKSFTR